MNKLLIGTGPDQVPLNQMLGSMAFQSADQFTNAVKLKEQIDSLLSDISSRAKASIAISAGNGLTGGGDLSDNRTISLGTPGTLNRNTTNSVTGTSHTHALDTQTSTSDTNQGKLMTVGAFGLGGIPLETEDWNTAQIGGAIYSALNAANSPLNNVWLIGRYQYHNINHGVQEVVYFTAANPRHFIRNFSGGVWQPWAEIYNSSNLTKSTIGLGNVDNTADADKPVSTPTQNALDQKADKSTKVWGGTGLTGGGDLTANRSIELGTPSTLSKNSTNAVTSTSHTHALDTQTAPDDATVGRIMTVGAFGIGTQESNGGALLIQDGDWNNATISGAIYRASTAANAPLGGNKWFIGTFWRHNVQYGTQILTTFTDDVPRMFVRSQHTSNGETVWGPWHEIFNSGNLTKDKVGLGNVDNTADVNKPVSNAVQSALDGEVPVGRNVSAGNGLTGGGNLSENRALSLATPSTITTSTTNSVQANSHTHALNINKNDVGLGNVDNTADVNKPVSVPTQNALDGKVPNERIISAGNGLTGGGNLSGNRSLTLGTPGTLNANTTNAVQATSHTHSIDVANQAEAEAGTDNTKLMTPARTRQLVSQYGIGNTAGISYTPGDTLDLTDNTTPSGIYQIGPNTVGAPESAWGNVHWTRRAVGGGETQVAIYERTNGAIYYRTRGAGAWGVWQQLLAKNDYGIGVDESSASGAIEVTDWNDATIGGAIYKGSNAANKPANSSGWLIAHVLRTGSALNLVQIAHSFGGVGAVCQMWSRQHDNGSGTWSDWTEITGKVDASRTVTGGNGMTGGGDLTTNRVITMGTPGTITGTSANAVQATSHTHKLNITKADIGLGNVDNTADADKPVPTAMQDALRDIILCKGENDQDPNAATDPVILSRHANAPDSTHFWYIQTYFYVSVQAAQSNRCQIAIQYSDEARMYIRVYYYTVGWTAWRRCDFERDASNVAQLRTDYGLLELGPRNASYCHIYTDRPIFYFNKDVQINGSGVLTTNNSEFFIRSRIGDNAIGGVGSLVIARYLSNGGLTFGTSVAGSNLYAAGLNGTFYTSSLSGTWRACSYVQTNSSSTAMDRIGLFMRLS